MYFESSNFMILRNGIVQDQKHLKFPSQHFEETEKEKFYPNDSSSLKNLKNERQILS